MSFITPSITNAAAVVNTDNATPTFMNANLDPLKNFTSAIDGLTRITTSTTPYNITANTEVVLYIDASGGNKVVNLPAATGQYHSITVKKIDVSYNTVTVTRIGSDTIESNTGYALSPATTTNVIAMPDEARTYSPNGTQWRVESAHLNNRVAFRAYLTSALSMSITTAKVGMSTEDFDLSGNYTAASSRFTAPVTGLYEFSGQFRISATSTTTRVNFLYYKNGTQYQFATNWAVYSTAVTGDVFQQISPAYMVLNANDYIEFYYNLQAGTGTLTQGNDSTYWQGRLIQVTV